MIILHFAYNCHTSHGETASPVMRGWLSPNAGWACMLSTVLPRITASTCMQGALLIRGNTAQSTWPEQCRALFFDGGQAPKRAPNQPCAAPVCLLGPWLLSTELT